MTEGQKILIVDSDHRTAAKLASVLSKDNYIVKETGSITDGDASVDSFRPDLVILDPFIRGSNEHKKLQKFWETYHIPVLVISEKGDVVSKVLSLEMGADDYLVKPFDMREFLARVHALLRRSGVTRRPSLNTADTIELPDLSISLSSYSVFFRGERLSMPPKEIELLYFLASSPNQVFTREQLLSQIWGYDYVGDTRTVDVHIKRLRRKLPAGESWSIATVWGVGYKLQVSS